MQMTASVKQRVGLQLSEYRLATHRWAVMTEHRSFADFGLDAHAGTYLGMYLRVAA